MKVFKVDMWFNPICIQVSAKTKKEAKKKAYDKLSKRSPLKFVIKNQTETTEL